MRGGMCTTHASYGLQTYRAVALGHGNIVELVPRRLYYRVRDLLTAFDWNVGYIVVFGCHALLIIRYNYDSSAIFATIVRPVFLAERRQTRFFKLPTDVILS